MKNRVKSQPLLIFFISIFSFIPSAAQKFTTPEGISLEARVKPEKETILLGESTFLTFEIENFSNQDLTISKGGDYRNEHGRPDSYKVRVLGSNGSDSSLPPSRFNMGGMITQVKIPAHGVYVERLLVAHWAKFIVPGTYDITVIRTFHPKSAEGKVVAFPVNARTELVVAPYNDKKMGGTIDELGKRMLVLEKDRKILDSYESESYRAAKVLATIDDKRTIPYFARALEPEASWYDITSIAIRALAASKEEAAFKALERASSSPVDNIRMEIPGFLALGGHPRALSVIAPLRKDTNKFVRGAAARAISRFETDIATAYLREMVDDEDAQIRIWVKEFLDKRNPITNK